MKPTTNQTELLITNCKDSLVWYASKVGKRVEYRGMVGGEYKSKEDGGYTNYVCKEDAVIVPTITPPKFADDASIEPDVRTLIKMLMDGDTSQDNLMGLAASINNRINPVNQSVALTDNQIIKWVELSNQCNELYQQLDPDCAPAKILKGIIEADISELIGARQ